ncbi:MAG: alcohol dehydrogenase catalytic domain-containing protein [Gemmatimonadota bacterium]
MRLQAIRFHYNPLRYIATRMVAKRRPSAAVGSLGCTRLDDVDPPALPGPGWVRVRTVVSGICGSDLSAVTAHDSFTLEPFGAFPFTFGHENVGTVAEVAGDVGDWRVGDRVVVNPMLACEQRGLDPCAACLRGERGLCRRTVEGDLGVGPMAGYNPVVGGGWAGSFVAHRSQLHEAGELDDRVAVLTDPFASALRPVLLHPPRTDDVALVIGAGTIGLLTIRALRLVGYGGTIAATARYDAQRRMAEAAGADVLLRGGDDALKWAASLPGARVFEPSMAPDFVEGGPSLVFDTVGSQRTVGEALTLTREGGRLVLVGGAAKVTADWTRVWYRQLTIAGVIAYGDAPFRGQRRDIYDIALELMREGGLNDLDLVTHEFGLEDYRDALDTALDKRGRGSIKVVFRPN